MALTRRLFSEMFSSPSLRAGFWSLQAVLEEPEVVLTLASWGFSAHAGFEGSLPPPPTAGVVGSDSGVSDISQDAFDGGDNRTGRRAAINASGINTTGVRPKVFVCTVGFVCCVGARFCFVLELIGSANDRAGRECCFRCESSRGMFKGLKLSAMCGAFLTASLFCAFALGLLLLSPRLPACLPACPPVAWHKTPAECKEEMVREFRRWAGYTPYSRQGPAPDAAVAAPFAAAPSASPPGLEATATNRAPRARGRRPSTSVLLREEGARITPPASAAREEDQEAGGGGRARPRARSLSSRSMPHAGSDGSSSGAGAGGGRRSAKRNKSSGPFGRANRERQHARGSGLGGGTADGTGGVRSPPQSKTPWGVGPIKGEARERAQAWANANLVVRSRSRSSRRRSRASRRGHGGSSGCCGGRRKVGTGPAKSTISGSRRAAAAGGRVSGGRHGSDARPARRERAAERASLAASALDVTWEVLDAEGYPKLTPRQRRKLFPMDEEDEADETDDTDEAHEVERAAVALSNGAPLCGGKGVSSGGGGGGGRTDRVVEMLASLEKAVMDVCKVQMFFTQMFCYSSGCMHVDKESQVDTQRSLDS